MGLLQEVVIVKQVYDRFQMKVCEIAKDLKIKPKQKTNDYLVKLCLKIKNKEKLYRTYFEITERLNREYSAERYKGWG